MCWHPQKSPCHGGRRGVAVRRPRHVGEGRFQFSQGLLWVQGSIKYTGRFPISKQYHSWKTDFFVNQPELTPDTSSAPNRLVNITWMNLFLGGSPHNHCRADCAPWAQFAASVALVAIGLQEKTTKVEKWRWTKAAKTCIWMVDKDFDGEVSIRLATGTYEHPKMSRFHLFCFNISHFWTLKELKKPG